MSLAGSAWHRQKRLLQGAGQRGGTADADPGHRLADGLAGGPTEERTRQALRIADAMAPCIVFIDEIEKGLSASRPAARPTAASRPGCSGCCCRISTTTRATSSSSAPPTTSPAPPGVHPGRALRRDLLPRPARVAGEGAIWRLYLERFGLDPAQKRPRDRDLTGAEIRSCCRLAALLDVPLVEAAPNIVPVAVTAGESVENACGTGPQADACRPTGPASTARGCQPRQGGRSVHRGDPSTN